MAVKLLDEALAKLDLLLARFNEPASTAPHKAPAAAAAAAVTPAAVPEAASASPAPVKSTTASAVETSAPAPPASTAQAAPPPDLAAAQTLFDKVLIKVCAGLRQFLTADELRDRMVCVVANLKPAKLAGQASEAMILAAEAPVPEATGGVLVRTLLPPANASPGDQVFLSGGRPSVAFVKVLKSDDFKKVAAQLLVLGGCACYAGHQLTTAAGGVTLAADVPNGSHIH
ncbi:MAG: hypothetical protein WDW38_001428 [Sanguina aurantia]